VVDHHVDRPGVYARQRAQLTGPNRPIGSRPPHHAQQPSTSHRATGDDAVLRHRHGAARTQATSKTMRRHQNPIHPTTKGAVEDEAPRCGNPTTKTLRGLRRPGGHGGGAAPDPIPNSDVKTTSAHDTAPQGAGKSVAARSSEPSAHTRHRRALRRHAHKRHRTRRRPNNQETTQATPQTTRRQATSKVTRQHDDEAVAWTTRGGAAR